MPLTLNGVVLEDLPLNIHSLFQTYPHFKESAAALCAQPTKVVGPVGLLYVQQREYAVTVPHDKNVTILGSDDATTCHIAVLKHSGSGVVCLSHLDGCGLLDAASNMARSVQDLSIGYPEGRLELHLIGGFQDPRGFSEELSLSILNAFHKQPIELELVTACICEINSRTTGGIHCPVIYGIGVNVKTGEIFPATFPEKGPEIPLRTARHFTGTHQVLDIYDCSLGLLRIGPFNYEPLRGVDLWLQQGDDFILQHLSTSPEVEPPHFVMQVRASLKHIQEHPFPAVTIFPDNRPHFYRKDESGAWIQVRY